MFTRDAVHANLDSLFVLFHREEKKSMRPIYFADIVFNSDTGALSPFSLVLKRNHGTTRDFDNNFNDCAAHPRFLGNRTSNALVRE